MSETFAKLTVSQQLVRKIQTHIERGAWKAGTSVPSLRSIARQYGVSLNTTQKAMRELISLGLIDQQPGQTGVIKAGGAPRRVEHRQIAWVEPFDPRASSDYWGDRIMSSARGILAQAGFRVTVLTYQNCEADPLGQVRRLVEPLLDQLAGIYMPTTLQLAPMIPYVEKMGLPWMTVSPAQSHITHNFVAADNLGAGRMAGRCFARLGVRRIAFLHFSMSEQSPLNKAAGLCQGYFEQEMAPPAIDLVRCIDQEAHSGYEAMQAYLKDHEPPQGLFATGDLNITGAIRAAQDAGLSVPQDVSAIGSTGIPSDSHVFKLASAAQPVEQMGEQIASGFVRMICEGVRRVAGRTIPCRYVPGDSFNAPREVQRQWAAGSGGGKTPAFDLSTDHSTSAADAVETFYSKEVQHESRILQNT